jgi:preprotein translocase subunit SecA
MNKQRTAIYTRRNHALFGDRLALDIDNAFSVTAEELVNSYRQQEDFEGFKLSCIVNFGIDSRITEEVFRRTDIPTLIDELYAEAIENYQRHKESVRTQAIPVFKNIRQTQGGHIENVVVPFTDGRKAINVLTNLDKTISSEGDELVNALERTITLAIIDDNWKEHLRAMDDLKQSVQTAYLEQKDPLVIYKVEAYNLFRQMSSELNKEVVSFLCHAALPVQQEEAPQQLREGRQQKTDMSRMRVNKEEIDAIGDDYAANEKDYIDPSGNGTAVKQQPVKVGPKVGRNDPCPAVVVRSTSNATEGKDRNTLLVYLMASKGHFCFWDT